MSRTTRRAVLIVILITIAGTAVIFSDEHYQAIAIGLFDQTYAYVMGAKDATMNAADTAQKSMKAVQDALGK